MKQCFFCLENIQESAEACKYCGNWQPDADEISSAWKTVLRTQVRIPVAAFLVFFVLFVFLIAGHKVESLDVFLLVWIIVPYVFARNMYRQRKDIYVFANAVELDRLLQQELKERRLKKYRSLKPLLVIFGILILVTISNPAMQEFQEYYRQEKNAIVVPSKTNLIICSVYVTNTEMYLGIAGNFFHVVSLDSSSQQNQNENVPK